ncbi:MAG: SMP-30/gluconolactonase/LRE family protein, partial [Kiritimatiellae bacterium]|nr:SMP-30/gluconolactonase/LRE family protein [Kiritimatiellia bacterium]
MNRCVSNPGGFRILVFLFLCITTLAGGRSGQAGPLLDRSKPESRAATPKSTQKQQKKVYPTIGTIERFDQAVDVLVAPDAHIEKLVGGLEWAEGPVWDKKTKTLLFSDVPRNVVFQWKEGIGTRDFLYPSGYTGSESRGGEPGSNGLTFDSDHYLVLCQHGDRRVARYIPGHGFVTLAEYYLDRRFNSPNDLVYKSNGDLYFTDPPYGLEKLNDDPRKELLFNGVYLLRRNGEVVLLTRELTFPNGIAFSPDEKTLYVAVSDQTRPVIMAYEVKQDGTLGVGRVFFDASQLLAGRKGLPDGLKVDVRGNLFA